MPSSKFSITSSARVGGVFKKMKQRGPDGMGNCPDSFIASTSIGDQKNDNTLLASFRVPYALS